MKKPLLAAAFLLAGANASPVLGQGPFVEGEVTKIDTAQMKVTVRHDEIPNLEMPPMTMVFRVADPAMLDTMEVGKEIRFTADRVNGAITITSVEE